MPQRFGLYEDLSVAENLKLYADLRGLPRSECAARFEELLAFTDLKRFTSRPAGKLSGGMKQKLGLACALVRKPRLLLLDEPAVGVDPISRRELWRMVNGLKDDGVGVVWSTAYLDEAEACDHVLLLNEGKLLFDGPPRELTKRTANRVFRMTGVEGRRRRVLAAALAEPEVIDGVIQGRALRLVTRGAAPPPAPAGAGPNAPLVPTPPRFEDSFIDILGGGPGGRSELAESMRVVEASPGPVIVADGLTKRFGDFTAASDVYLRGGARRDLRPARPERRGQVDHLPDAVRAAQAERRGGARRGDRPAPRHRRRAQPARLHGAEVLAVRRSQRRRRTSRFFAGAYGLTGDAQARADRADDGRLRRSATGCGRPPRSCPLGFKQRLALACAVMHEPEALFLDEPTSGVDPLTRREFWTHINGLVEKGVAVVVTTHFMDEAEYCDRISLIYRGQSIALGSPDELKSRAATAERPEPTMEDAFIALIEANDRAGAAA